MRWNTPSSKDSGTGNIWKWWVHSPGSCKLSQSTGLHLMNPKEMMRFESTEMKNSQPKGKIKQVLSLTNHDRGEALWRVKGALPSAVFSPTLQRKVTKVLQEMRQKFVPCFFSAMWASRGETAAYQVITLRLKGVRPADVQPLIV